MVLFVFRTVPGVWYCLFLEQFRVCGIVCFLNCPESVVLFDIRIVLMVGHCDV